MSETLPEKLARIGDEAYEHRNDPIPPGTKVTRGHDRTKTLQVRLNDDEYDRLKSMADAAELPVSTMVRSMILRQMQPTDKRPAVMITHIVGELEVLRDQVEKMAS